MRRLLILTAAALLVAPATGRGGDPAQKLQPEAEALRKELAAAKAERDRYEIQLKALTEEALRLRDESKALADLVKKREQQLLQAEQQAKADREKAAAERLAFKARLEACERRIKELELPAPRNDIRDPAYHNPPATFLKGTVRKVAAKDPKLVELSLGSDAGVKVDHTLEVYRLDPKEGPAYLGRVRIIESFPHHSVGRLLPVGGAKVPQIREGDQVASQIK